MVKDITIIYIHNTINSQSNTYKIRITYKHGLTQMCTVFIINDNLYSAHQIFSDNAMNSKIHYHHQKSSVYRSMERTQCPGYTKFDLY